MRAHPGARQERVALLPDDSLEVWVRARARDGQANQAIVAALAAAVEVRPGAVTLVSGQTSRWKVLEVSLPGIQGVRDRLARTSHAPTIGHGAS